MPAYLSTVRIYSGGTILQRTEHLLVTIISTLQKYFFIYMLYSLAIFLSAVDNKCTSFLKINKPYTCHNNYPRVGNFEQCVNDFILRELER